MPLGTALMITILYTIYTVGNLEPYYNLALLLFVFSIMMVCSFIIGIIGLVALGIYIYIIGKNANEKLMSIGGIVLIIFTFVGGFLIYITLKRLILDLESSE